MEEKQIIETMMHAIGLWPHGRRRSYRRYGKMFYRPYRNYFDTAPNCNGYWILECLEKSGYAIASKEDDGEIWHLTRRGLDWLGMMLNITIYDVEH